MTPAATTTRRQAGLMIPDEALTGFDEAVREMLNQPGSEVSVAWPTTTLGGGAAWHSAQVTLAGSSVTRHRDEVTPWGTSLRLVP